MAGLRVVSMGLSASCAAGALPWSPPARSGSRHPLSSASPPSPAMLSVASSAIAGPAVASPKASTEILVIIAFPSQPTPTSQATQASARVLAAHISAPAMTAAPDRMMTVSAPRKGRVWMAPLVQGVS